MRLAQDSREFKQHIFTVNVSFIVSLCIVLASHDSPIESCEQPSYEKSAPSVSISTHCS